MVLFFNICLKSKRNIQKKMIVTWLITLSPHYQSQTVTKNTTGLSDLVCIKIRSLYFFVMTQNLGFSFQDRLTCQLVLSSYPSLHPAKSSSTPPPPVALSSQLQPPNFSVRVSVWCFETIFRHSGLMEAGDRINASRDEGKSVKARFPKRKS